MTSGSQNHLPGLVSLVHRLQCRVVQRLLSSSFFRTLCRGVLRFSGRRIFHGKNHEKYCLFLLFWKKSKPQLNHKTTPRQPISFISSNYFFLHLISSTGCSKFSDFCNKRVKYGIKYNFSSATGRSIFWSFVMKD